MYFLKFKYLKKIFPQKNSFIFPNFKLSDKKT